MAGLGQLFCAEPKCEQEHDHETGKCICLLCIRPGKDRATASAEATHLRTPVVAIASMRATAWCAKYVDALRSNWRVEWIVFNSNSSLLSSNCRVGDSSTGTMDDAHNPTASNHPLLFRGSFSRQLQFSECTELSWPSKSVKCNVSGMTRPLSRDRAESADCLVYSQLVPFDSC